MSEVDIATCRASSARAWFVRTGRCPIVSSWAGNVMPSRSRSNFARSMLASRNSVAPAGRSRAL
jgi:hypothetical protein